MNPYQPYFEIAEEFAPDPEECPGSAYEAAMIHLFSERERQHLADWAVRHRISPDDPAWHLVELAALTNRWTQETLEDLERAIEVAKEGLEEEYLARHRRLQADAVTHSREVRQQLNATLRETSGSLVARVEAVVGTTTREVIGERLQAVRVPLLLGAVTLCLAMPAMGYLVGRQQTAIQVEGQRRATEIGEQLLDRYPGLDHAQKVQLHQAMGWAEPLD